MLDLGKQPETVGVNLNFNNAFPDLSAMNNSPNYSIQATRQSIPIYSNEINTSANDNLFLELKNLSTIQSQEIDQIHSKFLGNYNQCLVHQRADSGNLALNLSSNSNSNLNCSSEDLYDNIDFHPEKINFSDIQLLWTVKEPLNVFFRVSLVAPIILLGILGNLTIIYSMCKFKPFRSKPTNIFILNMAIADLLTTLVCPSAALFSYIYQFYVLGSFICRIEGFIKITCFLVSSYSLIVLSSDWLLCVVKPCRKRITIGQSWLALAAIWTVSLVMAAPLLFWRKLRYRQWKDLEEVWCCELIQYSKYYWVVINVFLIYLPTFFMTIVLVIILAQMDKFEAKLRRSRSSQSSSASLTININYRRRIVKILFTYLSTSIICWTPLQVFIIYRHFRTQSKVAAWFFELQFFTSLSASLTAATNPIIFGFLSQPFRKVVKRTLMFRMFDKIIISNNNDRNNNNNNSQNRQHEIFVIQNINNIKHNKTKKQNKQSCQSSHKNFNNQLPATNRIKRNQLKQFESRNKREDMLDDLDSGRSQRGGSSLRTWSASGKHRQTTENSLKRVSFETKHLHKEQQVKGEQNSAYIPDCSLSRANSAPRPNTNYHADVPESPSGPSKATKTTSFIRSPTKCLNIQPEVSAISMDSINIEENLAELGSLSEILNEHLN